MNRDFSAVQDLLKFIDDDMLKQRILKAVIADSGAYQDDPAVRAELDVMSRRLGDERVFWDLRCAVRWSARRIRATSYLEIGNRTGWSLLQVVRERPGVAIAGFDLWPSRYADSPTSNPSELRETLKGVGHKGPLTFISGDSQITLPAFIAGLQGAQPGGLPCLDIVTVDGDHSTEVAGTDLQLCAGLVKPGGMIIFDDLIHEKHPDLREVWHAFSAAHPEFICVENLRDYPGTGLGFRLPLPSFIPKRVLKAFGVQAKPASPLHSKGLAMAAEETGYKHRFKQHEQMAMKIESLRTHHRAKTKALVRARTENEALRGDRRDKEQAIQRLVLELDAVRADQRAKQAVIERMKSMLEARGPTPDSQKHN